MKKKVALVLGCTGQDGSYMCEYLIKKNYKVFGLYRKSATDNKKNIQDLISNNKIFEKKFFLIKGDLLDSNSIYNAISISKPDEIYNFADQDNVGWSNEIPSYSFNVTASSLINIYEILRKQKRKIRFFQPFTSNMFAWDKKKKQNENSLISPSSIYALSKASAYLASKMYNKIYNLNICGAIYFNHESPRRNKEYVSQKIVRTACDIYKGKKNKIELGDINIKIDWGYAPDYVDAAWNITQLKKPDFFTIGSGKGVTVENFAKNVFNYLNLDFKKYLRINKKFIRKSKNFDLVADTSKAKKIFNFKPKTDLKKMIKVMIEHELKKKKND